MLGYKELIRVVALRKGKLIPAEFRIRKGERGLSLFLRADFPGNRTMAHEYIEAVSAMGKRGELAVAALEFHAVRSLGLKIVGTPGATGIARIDELHVEARLPLLRRLSLIVRGIAEYDYFNEVMSPKLCAIARILQ